MTSPTEGLMKKRPRPQAVPDAPAVTLAVNSNGTREAKYIAAALYRASSDVRDAPKGVRNDVLNAAAFGLGRLIGAGALDEGAAESALRIAAAWEAPSVSAQDAKKIADGIRAGKADPRPIPPPKTTSYSDDGGRSWTTMLREPADASNDAAPGESPTAEDPLRGLKHLGPIALLGRDRLLAMAATPVVYTWQDILVAGTIMLIAGPPAEGKTTLLFLGLVARAKRGAPVVLLGRKIEPAPLRKYIVLIEGEHSESSTARKLVKSMTLLGVDDSALDRIIVVARKAVLLGSAEWMDVVQLCRAGLVSDIGLDTIARVAPADANDEREQVAIFNLIAMAIEVAPDGMDKPTVWAVAHTRKNDTSGSLADVSGSAQRTGQADTVLLVKGEKVDGRTVSTTVTFAKLREDPDDYPTPVTFSITKTADGEPCLDTTDAGAAKSDDRPLEERITEALRSGAQTKGGLAKLLGRSWKDVDTAITTLFQARAIRTGTPKLVKGKDCTTYELKDGSRPFATAHPADEFDADFQVGTGAK